MDALNAMNALNALVSLEDQLSVALGWPGWALRTVILLSVLVLATSMVQFVFMGKGSKEEGAGGVEGVCVKGMTTEFRMFQLSYLSVYLTIMLADWLQGTNMYTLYSSYGVNVGTLFLTGIKPTPLY
jgi:hypothetical protein